MPQNKLILYLAQVGNLTFGYFIPGWGNEVQ